MLEELGEEFGEIGVLYKSFLDNSTLDLLF
jgi:hypothetical protein